MAQSIYTNHVNDRFHTNLHIAADEKYLGSIKAYKGRFVGFLTKLFRISTDITINNQRIRVNKRNYIHFLHSLGVNSACRKTIKEYKNFNAVTFSPPSTTDFMRHHISAQKAHALGVQLIKAIVEERNFSKAKDLMGIGAEVNLFFCNRSCDQLSVIGNNPHLGVNLPEKEIAPIEEHLYTPLLYAAEKNQSFLRDLLLQYGADQTVSGQSRVFRREVISRSQSSTDYPVTRTVGVEHVPVIHWTSGGFETHTHFHPPHHHPFHHPYRCPVGPRIHQTYVPPQPIYSVEHRDVTRPGIDRKTQETVHFKDSYENVRQIRYDSTSGRTTEMQEANSEHRWSTSHVISVVNIA